MDMGDWKVTSFLTYTFQNLRNRILKTNHFYSISHVVSLPDSLSISFMSNDIQNTLFILFSKEFDF